MAFPTTITTDGLATVGIAGPYISAGGNIYVIVVDDQRFDLRALKATDPTSSFAGQGTDVVIGSGLDIIRSIAGYQVGDNIHVITKNSNSTSVVDIRYHIFSMASDTWTTTNEAVKTDMELAPGGSGWSAGIDIAVRGDGHVLAVYNGPPETVATVQYDRVFYARRIAGTWSADIALGTAGVAASWIGGRVIIGANDRAHFFVQDTTNADLYQRTLTSAYALEALPAAFEASALAWEAHEQRGVYIAAANLVSFPWYDALETLSRQVFTSVDAPVLSATVAINSPTAVLTSPIRFVASHAVDDATGYNAFIGTNNDIYTQSNVGGAGWSTPNSFLVCSASAIFTTVLVRGAAKVLAMVYHDGDPKYTEMTLSVSLAASVSMPNQMLLVGAGR